jgi:PAS domain S-box-containing protein
MKKRNLNSNPPTELRKRAEFVLEKKPSAVKKLPPRDIQDLIEDLQIHQIELEMQNEELRKTHEDLGALKGIYEDLYDFAPVGYFTLDENNMIFRVNLVGAELFGLERHRLLGRRFSRFISPDWVDRFYDHRRQCLDTRERQTCELKLKSDAENQRYIHVESIAAHDDEGNFNRIRMAMIEITNRKKADERIRTLSRELLGSHEDERQMISRELHDRIAQNLSAVKLGYDSLLEGHPEIPEEIRQKNSALSKILQNTIMNVRDLSYELRPPELEKAGIAQTLFNYCVEFSKKSGIKVDFFCATTESIELDDLKMINIYRIVQEGLNNVQKHAEADHVNVTFSYSHPDILLRIIDNGKGFDVEKRLAAITSEKRMGLRSMEERAKLLGGTIEVQSMPMNGTKIFIRIPNGGKTHGRKENHPHC